MRDSGLEWTIVRAPLLTEGPRTGSYRVGHMGEGLGARVSRADVAEFLLQQTADAAYVGRAPLVGA